MDITESVDKTEIWIVSYSINVKFPTCSSVSVFILRKYTTKYLGAKGQDVYNLLSNGVRENESKWGKTLTEVNLGKRYADIPATFL